jgi:hypothetical protein
MTSCCGRSLRYLLEHHLIGLFILMLHRARLANQISPFVFFSGHKPPRSLKIVSPSEKNYITCIGIVIRPCAPDDF